jgi:hypothetical protein
LIRREQIRQEKGEGKDKMQSFETCAVLRLSRREAASVLRLQVADSGSLAMNLPE